MDEGFVEDYIAYFISCKRCQTVFFNRENTTEEKFRTSILVKFDDILEVTKFDIFTEIYI